MQTSTLWTIPPQYSLPVESHWHNGKKARRQYTLASVAYPLTRRERNYIEFDRIFVLKVLSYSDIIVDSIAKKRAMVSNKGPDCALRSNSSAINSCRGNTGGLMACPGDTHRRGPAETSMKLQHNLNPTSILPAAAERADQRHRRHRLAAAQLGRVAFDAGQVALGVEQVEVA
jgi:hypothetical protein